MSIEAYCCGLKEKVQEYKKKKVKKEHKSKNEWAI